MSRAVHALRPTARIKPRCIARATASSSPAPSACATSGSSADPTATRAALTEAYISPPLVMARVTHGPWRAAGTLNLEGLTLRRGELSTGAFGEGYVDRRHPHAYLHELMMGIEGEQGGL